MVMVRGAGPLDADVRLAAGEEVDREPSFAELALRAREHRARGRQIVVVQGLGYVGAAVAAVVAGASSPSGEPLYFVIGIEVPEPHGQTKVTRINRGEAPFVAPDPQLGALILNAVSPARGNLCAATCEEAYGLADVIVVDVPLDVHDRTNLDAGAIALDTEAFETAIRAVGRFMQADALVIVETTVAPGTCERLVQPLLEQERSARGIEAPVKLAYAYERVMPGPRYVDSIRRYWRTFAGMDAPSAELARAFLSSFIETDAFPLRELPDAMSCELAKVLENSYRAVNIAFIHEWTLLAERTGINLFDVIDSIRVRTGTHDNIRFPGFGVGGYCLTKDSLLAQWTSTHQASGLILGMTLEALRINAAMPLHTLDLLRELAAGDLAGMRVLVCGAAYLPDLDDTRNSPTEVLVDALCGLGAHVVVHDPYVRVWVERSHVALSGDLMACLDDCDAVVFAVPHSAYLGLAAEAIGPGESARFVVDAQNVLSDAIAEQLHRAGCRVAGVGKGHWRARGYHVA